MPSFFSLKQIFNILHVMKIITFYPKKHNKGSRKKNLVVGPLRAIIAKNKLVFHKKKGKLSIGAK